MLTELLYLVNEDVDPIDRVLAGCLGCVRRVLENVMEAEWIQTAPDAVECVKQDLDELLVFLSFPNEHWQLIRTTNHLERCFREFRRRLRPIGCQKNTASCERMLYSLCTRLNLRWKKKRIFQPTVFAQVA